MHTTTRHKPRPELMSERGRDTAERRATVAEQKASATLLGAERLSIELAEMREDRDRWRAQAERLAGALDRLRAPGDVAAPVPADDDADLLYGVPAIGAAMKVSRRRVYHLKDRHGLPTFKIGGTVCARRPDIVAWIAAKGAAALTAAQGGR